MSVRGRRLLSLLFLLIGVSLGYFLYRTNATDHRFAFRFGLDLSGGTHLVYKAHTEALEASQVADSLDSLRDVIERRVNLFGVSEPVVATERSGGENRLVVDLPGITNIADATALIGQTPVLDFRTERGEIAKGEILDAQKEGKRLGEDPYYIPTNLTGRYIKRATLDFNQTSFRPTIGLEFNDEGAKLFEELTRANVDKTIGIYLDGAPISAPVVREAISGGRAQISGDFTVDQAQLLVGRLNAGALPVAIELVSTRSVGASLGDGTLEADVWAGIYGFAALALFLILWYRLPGVIAVIALVLYIILSLSFFKLIPVVLTSAGIAGFILSIGMAVDANVLIFERAKEELARGRATSDALREGFARAWLSIRDSNVSSLITASVLFWMGTSLVKGFALTFGIGVILSMFTAITVTRTFLLALALPESRTARFLVGNGFSKMH